MTDILVLSSHSNPGVLASPLNHQVYATRHGYDYLFDATPYPLRTPYDQKLASVLATMRRTNAEWIFWVDDDAYFTRMDTRLETFLPSDPEVEFVVCRSPVNLQGVWSKINAGLFFVRNTERMRKLFEQALAADMDEVQRWWKPEEHGLFIAGGDQERLLYLFSEAGLMDTVVRVLPHEAFNARAYHYRKTAEDQFVCHLASHRDKLIPLADMRRRFGLTRELLTPDIDTSAFRWSLFAQPRRPPRKSGMVALAKQARGKVRGLAKLLRAECLKVGFTEAR